MNPLHFAPGFRAFVLFTALVSLASCDATVPLAAVEESPPPEIKVPAADSTYSGRIGAEVFIPEADASAEVFYSLDGSPRTAVSSPLLVAEDFEVGGVMVNFEIQPEPGTHELTVFSGKTMASVVFRTSEPEYLYQVEELEVAGDSLQIRGLTDRGTVLYSTVTAGVRNSFLRRNSGDLIEIGAFSALDVNNDETVVGFTGTWSTSLPVVWSDGKLEPLKDLTSGVARAITDSGLILFQIGEGHGIYQDGNYTYRTRGYASDLNSSGATVFVFPMDPESARISTGTELVTIGGSKRTSTGSINERGYAVFSSAGRGQTPVWGSVSNGKSDYRRVGTLFPRATEPSEWYSHPLEATYPTDLNDSNEVVGRANRISLDYRGFLWADGRIVDLTSLVPAPWVIDDAIKINEAGDILALGHLSDGASRVVYLHRELQ